MRTQMSTAACEGLWSQRPLLPNLVALNLSFNPIGDAGLAALSHRAARVPLSLAPLLLRKLLRKLLLPQPPPLG